MRRPGVVELDRVALPRAELVRETRETKIAVVVDLDYVRNAPPRLVQAGVGDVRGTALGLAGTWSPPLAKHDAIDRVAGGVCKGQPPRFVFASSIKVNGELASEYSTSKMLFSAQHYIAQITKYMTLWPGDVLWLGTDNATIPDLKHGDVVEITPAGSTFTRPDGTVVQHEPVELDWDEGPDVGGPHAPYFQSQRLEQYRSAAARLVEGRFAVFGAFPSVGPKKSAFSRALTRPKSRPAMHPLRRCLRTERAGTGEGLEQGAEPHPLVQPAQPQQGFSLRRFFGVQDTPPPVVQAPVVRPRRTAPPAAARTRAACTRSGTPRWRPRSGSPTTSAVSPSNSSARGGAAAFSCSPSSSSTSTR